MTFDDLLVQALPEVRAAARRIADRGTDPEDLLQGAVLRALRARARFTGPDVLPWMARMLRLERVDAYRRAYGRRDRTPRPQMVSTPDYVLDAIAAAPPPEDAPPRRRVLLAARTAPPARVACRTCGSTDTALSGGRVRCRPCGARYQRESARRRKGLVS